MQTLRVSLVFLLVTVALFTAHVGKEVSSPHNTYEVPRSVPALIPRKPNGISSGVSTTTTRPYDVVLTCLYISKGFYVGRAIPSLNWAVVFVLSLYKNRRSLTGVGTDTKLVIFSDAETGERLRGLVKERLGETAEFLEVVDIDWKVKYPGLRWANMTLLRNAANNFRFALFQEYIEHHKDHLDRIMLSDITDVAFQMNPFDGGCTIPSLTTKPIVRFTLEHHQWTFTNEKYNKRWMSCYPKEVTKYYLKGRAISCDGVTFGSVAGMRRYHVLMMREIENVAQTECSIKPLNAALDQANHNYILHVVSNPKVWKGEPLGLDAWATPMKEACAYHGNWYGPQMNGTIVVNGSNVVYPIVHQYTSCRRPPLMKIFRDQYLPGEPLEECKK